MRALGIMLLALLAAQACKTTGPGEDPPEDQRPLALEIAFSGNESLSQTSLEGRAPALFASIRRGKATRAMLADALWEIQEMYRTRGFPDVVVASELQGDPPKRVLFTIEEGRRVSLGRVRIQGAEALPAEALAGLLQAPRVRYLGLELGGGLFSQAALQAWRAEVAEAYRESGYLDVAVSQPIVERHDRRAKADVSLAIEEGPLYRFAPVTILGEREALHPATLRRVLALEGTPAAPARIARARSQLQAELAAAGRLTARVRIATRKDESAAQVFLTCEIHAGPKAIIEHIELTGLDRTLPSLVRSKLGLRPGDVLARDRLEKGLAALYRTGLFSRVDPEITLEEEGQKARLELAFQEALAQDIWLLGGGGSYEGPRLGAGYSHRNLFGTGRIFTTQANASYRILRTGASVTDPDFLLENLALTVSGHASRHKRPAFLEESYGTDVALARSISRHVRFRTAWSFTLEQARNVPDGLEEAKTKVRIGALQNQLTYDGRNALLAPTRGTLCRATVDLAARVFGGDTSFTRLRFELARLFYLGAGVVLAGRYETGLIYPWGSTRVIPLPERFFGGGESAVRSFRQDRLGPVNQRGKPIGGEFINTLGGELRVPLAGSLQGALFYDAGNVGLEAPDWNLRSLRQGVGVGLRYLLPVGPIRCDLAWNPDQRPEDDALVFHFSIGFPF